MLNNTVFVGKIKGVLQNFMEVDVHSKDDEDKYDSIPVELSENLYNTIYKYSNLGDLVGVKGRLANKDGRLIVIADKITLLSSTKGGD